MREYVPARRLEKVFRVDLSAVRRALAVETNGVHAHSPALEGSNGPIATELKKLD